MGENSLLRSEWEQLRAAVLGNISVESAGYNRYNPVITPIEFEWRDILSVDLDAPFFKKMLTADMPTAEYDEDLEPCTDEELEDFILHP